MRAFYTRLARHPGPSHSNPRLDDQSSGALIHCNIVFSLVPKKGWQPPTHTRDIFPILDVQ